MTIVKKKHMLFGTVRFDQGYPFLEDVAKALNYRDDSYKSYIGDNVIVKNNHILVNDEGIDALIVHSNIKTPIVFSQWMFEFILPSLRREEVMEHPKVNKETVKEQSLAKKLNDSFAKHVMSIDGWITIPVHGFSNNHMYSYTENGNIVKSKAYCVWRHKFPTQYLDKLSHIDFTKPIQAYYIFDHKEEFDTPNFNKSIADVIADYFGVDDHQIVNEICLQGKIVDTYDEGKIHIFLYNI